MENGGTVQIFLFIFYFSFLLGSYAENDVAQSKRVLSRRKRYVVFPKGSSLQLVYCNTYFLPETTIFKIGTSAGLAWMLPDSSDVFLKKKHKIFKRSIYNKLESYINAHDVNGKACILRALCESGQRTPAKLPFVQEILHKIFSPGSDLQEEEDGGYLEAHRSVNSNCSTIYRDCAFSFFQ